MALTRWVTSTGGNEKGSSNMALSAGQLSVCKCEAAATALSNGCNVTLTIPHGETVRRRRQRADAATKNRRRRWSTAASGDLLSPALIYYAMHSMQDI